MTMNDAEKLAQKEEELSKLRAELAVFKEEKSIDDALISGQGDATKSLLKNLPDVTRELYKQVIETRDRRARERLRKQIRALGDFIFSDTQEGQPINKKKSSADTQLC